VLTAEQAYLVRKSFAELERHREVAALVFYRHLFQLDPSLRPLFKSDIAVQSRKLMDMLGALIALLGQPDRLAGELRDLGARHAGYGVRDAHYATVREALLAMIRETLQDRLSGDGIGAWNALYDVVESEMKAGARDAGEGSRFAHGEAQEPPGSRADRHAHREARGIVGQAR
jgi:hemoglobin-like flavoprotein